MKTALADPSTYDLAEQVGAELARLGYAVANGGYGGAMEASAKGAKGAHGRTIGVTCPAWSSQPNRFLDCVVETDCFRDRLFKLIEMGPPDTWSCRAARARSLNWPWPAR